MLILYCDFYVVNDSLEDLERLSKKSKRFDLEYKIRSSDGVYRFREKIDVCKYMLDSYSVIEWDGVCIRFECEDKNQEKNFYDFIKLKFPEAHIFNQRSDSAYKYIKNLEYIKKLYGNPWVFFAPNNDHIFISPDNNIKKYIKYLDEFEIKYESFIISLFYSHFTEMMNISDSRKVLWGDQLLFPEKIYEDNDVIALKMNRFCCDSIQIYRLDVILNIFKKTNKVGKIIRLENTEFYMSNKILSIVLVPKIELFRHYDGYFHRDCWVAKSLAPSPLFIPDGFFKNKLEIRYGYSNYASGKININPNERFLSYSHSGKPDLNHDLNLLPYFWKIKGIDIDINNNYLESKSIKYYENLVNPFSSLNRLMIKFYQTIYIIRSIKNIIYNKIRYYIAVKLRNKRFIWKLKRLKKLL